VKVARYFKRTKTAMKELNDRDLGRIVGGKEPRTRKTVLNFGNHYRGPAPRAASVGFAGIGRGSAAQAASRPASGGGCSGGVCRS
jgi:hypothetical protein